MADELNNPGMSLGMNDSVAQDLRYIMSEQLMEIKDMNASIKEGNQASALPGLIPAKNNPYSQMEEYNGYYSQTLNGISSGTLPNYDNFGPVAPLENKPGMFSSIGAYAQETGYNQLFWGDRMINGRGISDREAELAKMEFQDRIVTGITDKIGGPAESGIGFGAELGVGAALGGIPGIAIGAVTGMAVRYGTNQIIEDFETKRDFRRAIYQSSDRFISAAENEGNFAGFSRRDSRKAAREMMGIMDDFDLTGEEMTEIFQGAVDQNLITTATDVEDFGKKMTELVSVVKTSAKTLGKTLTEVTNMMGELEREGIGIGSQSLIMGNIDAVSAGLGMSSEAYAASLAARTGNLTNNTSADAGSTSLSLMAGDMILGTMQEAAKRTIESGTDLASDRAVANYTGDVSSISNSLNSAFGTVMQNAMAASLVKTDNGYVIDQDKLLDYTSRYGSDTVGVNQEMFKAQDDFRTANKLSSAEFTTALRVAGDEFQSEHVTAYSGAMSKMYTDTMLSLVSSETGLSARELDAMRLTDPVRRENLIQTVASNNAIDPAEALVISRFADTSGMLTESQQIAGAAFSSAANKAENEKGLGALAWWKNVPDFLKDYTVSQSYNYGDVSLTDRKWATQQSENTVNAILYGTLDEDTAADYKNMMNARDILDWTVLGIPVFGANAGVNGDAKTLAEAFKQQDIGDTALGRYVEMVGGTNMINELRTAKAENNDDTIREIARELMIKTDESMASGTVGNKSLVEGISKSDAEKATQAVDAQNKAIKLLIDTLPTGLDNTASDIYNFLDYLNEQK